MINSLVQLIRDWYGTPSFIPLHAPQFIGKEQDYVLETINSTFVSSVGAFVDRFEQDMATYTKSPHATVTVNGTSALHISLLLAGVRPNDYVITQALTFVATANAIRYCQAQPIFIDVDKSTLGLSPYAVNMWLEEFAFLDNSGQCRLKQNNRVIKACLPMHTFGHPVDLDSLLEVCNRWGLVIIEDAAESLGSLYKSKHTGTLGQLGVLSFNGNKILTTGGGGMILTNPELGKRAKHLTTTAKLPHPYEYYHDEIGYNYRMPNLNAALGCAQLEQLENFIENKRALAQYYHDFFSTTSVEFVKEPSECRSNYWLNAIICEDSAQRDEILTKTNDQGILTRPIWQSLNTLPMFNTAPTDSLTMTAWLAERVVNLPSSVNVSKHYA